MVFLLRSQNSLEECGRGVLAYVKSLPGLVISLTDVGDAFREVVEKLELTRSPVCRCVGSGWGRKVRIQYALRGAGMLVRAIQN